MNFNKTHEITNNPIVFRWNIFTDLHQNTNAANKTKTKTTTTTIPRIYSVIKLEWTKWEWLFRGKHPSSATSLNRLNGYYSNSVWFHSMLALHSFGSIVCCVELFYMCDRIIILCTESNLAHKRILLRRRMYFIANYLYGTRTI